MSAPQQVSRAMLTIDAKTLRDAVNPDAGMVVSAHNGPRRVSPYHLTDESRAILWAEGKRIRAALAEKRAARGAIR